MSKSRSPPTAVWKIPSFLKKEHTVIEMMAVKMYKTELCAEGSCRDVWRKKKEVFY